MLDIYPFPLSNLASMTEPVDNLLGFALSSKSSASNNNFSKNSSIPTPFRADIS